MLREKISAAFRRIPAFAVLTALSVSCLLSGTASGSRKLTSYAAEPADGTVLFQENFDDMADGTVPEGWTVNSALEKGGSVKVQNKALVIDATNVELGKVLLPESLAEYGNYTIEADITFDKVRDAARWFSLVFRQQEEDETYYHMCVRSNSMAGNGVEFAARTPGNWNVMTTASASHDASVGTTVHLAVSVYDNLVYEYFDDELVIETNALGGLSKVYDKGRVGLQANFSVVTVDNVKVTALTKNPAEEKVEKTSYVQFDKPYTSIVSPATVVAKINSAAELDAALAKETKPQVLMLFIDGSLNVTNEAGTAAIGTVAEVFNKIDMRCIPAFYVKTQEAADALGGYLKQNKIVDAFVVSDNASLVTAVRKTNRKIYGVVDYRATGADAISQDAQANNHNSLDNIVYTTNENMARIALISESIATKENVNYLQNRLITVWVEESADKSAQLHNSIQSGANGILTDTPDELYSAYQFYADNYTLVRNPFIIGHRGLPSAAPENSLESAIEAYTAGADCIELDIRLSKDGVVMIYHDDDIAGLTTGRGSIASHTYDELRSYDLLSSSGYGSFQKYPAVKIATLEEFFERFQNEDVVFFIEIKESSNELLRKTAELVEKYNMKNKIAFITFITTQIPAVQKMIPGVSVGCLMSTPSASTTEKAVESIINSIGSMNTTFNANGVNDTRLVRALMNRGITAWPWTYNASSTGSAYLLGVGGVTTDHANVASDIPIDIRLNADYVYTLSTAAGSANELTYSPTVLTRTGEFDLSAVRSDGTPVGKPELILVDGKDVVEVDGDTIRAKGVGTAYLLYRYHTSANPLGQPNSNYDFSIYSQLITINVVNDAVTDENLPTSAPTPSSGSEKSGCGSMIGGGAAILAVISAAALLLRKKEK